MSVYDFVGVVAVAGAVLCAFIYAETRLWPAAVEALACEAVAVWAFELATARERRP